MAQPTLSTSLGAMLMLEPANCAGKNPWETL